MTLQDLQQEQELVAGVIQGITAKPGDKWQVNVIPDGGGQYTKNLWTDDQSLVMQLQMLLGSHQVFLCRVSNWTRSDGSPVRSLWIQGVGPESAQPLPQMAPPPQQQPQMPVQAGGQITTTGVPMPQVTPQPQVTTHDEREARIHRQTASKVAAILISHLPSEQRTLDNLLRIAENMVAYYEHGMPVAQRYDDGDPGPQGVPHGDEDIPF